MKINKIKNLTNLRGLSPVLSFFLQKKITVTPAKAGVSKKWLYVQEIPASAGMT